MTPVTVLLERLHAAGAELVVVGPAHRRSLRWLALPAELSLSESWALIRDVHQELLEALDVPRCPGCGAVSPAPGVACDPCGLGRRNAVCGFQLDRTGITHFVNRYDKLFCDSKQLATRIVRCGVGHVTLCRRCIELRDRRRTRLNPVSRLPRDAWRRL